MSFDAKIISLAQGIGADIKSLTAHVGDVSALTTTAKTSLVAALNELKAIVDPQASTEIVDGVTATTTTWSSSKINAQISNAVSALVSDAPGTMDTLNELSAALANDPSFATTIATQIANRVRYDSIQTLTVDQQKTACANIGIGDPTTDFVAAYTAAKV